MSPFPPGLSTRWQVETKEPGCRPNFPPDGGPIAGMTRQLADLFDAELFTAHQSQTFQRPAKISWVSLAFRIDTMALAECLEGLFQSAVRSPLEPLK